MKLSRRDTGEHAEGKARDYLLQRGLKLLDNNYSCPHGEIDLILMDQQELVFVEVRYRQSAAFGGALESVDSRKQAKIQATAAHFIQANPKLSYTSCRFDVISMSGHIDNPTIDWLEAAF